MARTAGLLSDILTTDAEPDSRTTLNVSQGRPGHATATK